ncbi:heterokaryon incompatibility protein-domain-containing protein [Pyrenochaeta sp. MPI-SDFR-AT-0127]|nr:heterokaryon incompatibility protein-domain-containing protein [Pyrenochaeta sp. MPI-SDFR-AT-0127]
MTFKYEPLDHTKESIRLLRILPDLSDTGLIECQIWHDTVDATYDCLSYVWGSEQNTQDILVNGKTLSIRKNLWDFLGTARTKYATPPRTFWIDALCINQDSIPEKNHQVAQMGSIYSKAVEVVAWLGFSLAIQRTLTFWSELGALNPQTKSEAWKLWNMRNEQLDGQLGLDWDELANTQYWSRAWITQEILLARKFNILVNDFEFEPARFSAFGLLLPGIHKNGNEFASGLLNGSSWNSNTRVFNTYLEVMCGKRMNLKNSLVDLFHQLPRKGSRFPRDRIYSLRSVALNAATIPVDYASSDNDVLIHLLHVFRNSICLCLWSYMANILELDISPGLGDDFGQKLPVFKVAMRPHYRWDKSAELDSWILGEVECEEYKVNVNHLCNCIGYAELILYRYETDKGDKYTIKRDFDTLELDVIRVEIEGPFEISNIRPNGAISYGGMSMLF